MKQLDSGTIYNATYLTYPDRERRRVQPKTLILSFLITLLGMLLVASFAYGANAPMPSIHAGGANPECTLGGCPLTLTSNQNGMTLNYPIGSRFAVIPDSANADTALVCMPEGALRRLAWNDPAALHSPLLRFEAVADGTCIIRHGDFSITVRVSHYR